MKEAVDLRVPDMISAHEPLVRPERFEAEIS